MADAPPLPPPLKDGDAPPLPPPLKDEDAPPLPPPLKDGDEDLPSAMYALLGRAEDGEEGARGCGHELEMAGLQHESTGTKQVSHTGTPQGVLEVVWSHTGTPQGV